MAAVCHAKSQCQQSQGLSKGKIYARGGKMVASVTQTMQNDLNHCLYETKPKWHGFWWLDCPLRWPILNSEPQNIEWRMTKDEGWTRYFLCTFRRIRNDRYSDHRLPP